LAPNNAAYLDTLARCNFRIGNIEDAVTLQKQAIAAEPSMRELRRNLEVFQASIKQPND
jgi:predicted Zn-dependent protease